MRPQVRKFNAEDGSRFGAVDAFKPTYMGGVFVAAGDVNGDGKDELLVGQNRNGGPNVKVFDGASNTLLNSFFAYDPGFKGGVRVAAGDVNGDGLAEIITAAGPGSGPHVKVFDGQSLAVLDSFFAFDQSFTGGIFVAGAPAGLRAPQ